MRSLPSIGELLRALRAVMKWNRAIREHLRNNDGAAERLLDGVDTDLRGRSRVKAQMFRAKIRHANGRYEMAAHDYRSVRDRIEQEGGRIASEDSAYMQLYASIYGEIAERKSEGKLVMPSEDKLALLRQLRPSEDIEDLFPPPDEDT